MKPLHPPLTEFTLTAIDRYLQQQVPLQVEQHLQQTLPGWVKQCLSQSALGSETPWPPECSRWLDERLEQYWTTSLEPRIREVASTALDQLLEPLLTQVIKILTPQLDTLVRDVLTQAGTRT